MLPIATASLTLGVTIAALADLRTRRIPNVLTGTLAALAAILCIPGGWTIVASTFATMIVVFVLGTIAFSCGWFGGGDVKLLAASCGLAGLHGAPTLVFYTILAGGVLALVEAARRGRLARVVFGTMRIATHRLAPTSGTYIPYAIAIAAGTYVYVLTLSILPALRFPL